MILKKNLKEETPLNVFFKKHWLAPYMISGMFVLILYVLAAFFKISCTSGLIEKFMLVSVIILLAAVAAMFFTGRLSNEKLLIFLFAIGFVMRVGYMLYTDISTRQHDVGTIDWNGHARYIYILATTFSLPGTNGREFYHPPLMHILGAVVYNIANCFNSNTDVCMNAVRIIPCYASCATMIVSHKIFRNLKFSNAALILATMIVCFHPTFIILSASINNDMLSIFFIALALLYTIKWYNSRSMHNIVKLALATGFGMMTKISMADAAAAVAAVFIAVLVQSFKKKKAKAIIKEYCVFGFISLPIGLWYPIRNYILFRQPLWYVYYFHNIKVAFCGNRSIFERFLSFPLADIFTKIYGNSNIDCNIYTYILQSSMFGAWTFSPKTPAIVLTSLNLLLVVVSLAAMAYTFAFGKDSWTRFAKYFLGLLWVIEIATYIKFNVDYPFGFTMDFRYIVITLVIGAAFISMAYDIFCRRHTRLIKPVTAVLAAAISLFSFASIAFYIMV